MVAARTRALVVTCTSSSDASSIITTLPSTTARASSSPPSPSSVVSIAASTSSATRTSKDTSSRSMLTPRVSPSPTCRTASRPMSELVSKVPVAVIRPSSSRSMNWIVPTTSAP